MTEKTAVELKVSEAPTEDVGRGIVRVDPGVMKALSVDAGDVVQVVGTDVAVAKALPTRPKDRDQDLIQMDGVLRSNAKVKLDSMVTVESIEVKPAFQVVLKPLTINSRSHHHNTAYLKKSLIDMPIKMKDQVRVNLFGAGFQNFEVTHTEPKGAVIVEANTALSIESSDAEGEATPSVSKAGLSYEDIGGLKDQLDRIREMIELPLKYPQVFEQMGIDPPRGVLLYGPPGTGKTLIVRALAEEIDAYFISIAGPEVLSMYYGQSEANLRKVFNEAKRNQPAILFLDEIDAVTPKRNEVEGEVEKRVVSQILALMDGMEKREQVIIIGATNRPDSLDPALRRPGRFDREIVIPIPDVEGRVEILKIHTRGMPLDDNVELEQIAQVTHGFVGADLEALAREAAMKALRRMLPDLNLDQKALSYDALFNLRVERGDFEAALTEIEPSAMREVFVEVPPVRWEDVGGMDEIKQRLKQAIMWPSEHREAFDHFKLQPTTGIMLYGPPGTGKTLLAQAVANECGVNFISIKGPELFSKWVGDSEKRVRDLFKNARRAAPCIIFIDEMDALAAARGMTNTDTGDNVTSQLLTELNGLEGLRGVTVIGATNRIDLIEPALLRPGRLELHLETQLPDLPDRVSILNIHTKELPLADDVDLEDLALDMENFNGSHIFYACREASVTRIREHIESGGTQPIEELHLHQEDFKRIVGWMKTRIDDANLDESEQSH